MTCDVKGNPRSEIVWSRTEGGGEAEAENELADEAEMELVSSIQVCDTAKTGSKCGFVFMLRHSMHQT